MNQTYLKLTTCSAVSVLALAGACYATTASAQNLAAADAATASVSPAPAADAGDQGAIIVTARKTKEDVLKTPIAIAVLTNADIKARGIVTLNDIAAYTPGMNIDNNGADRSDRSFQQIIIRGFTPPNSVAQTTSVFIDGAPVSSATAVSNVTDPERVEILKGPQSAYFGRQTFAGAVNIVTRVPTDHWTGSFDGMVGTRHNYDVTGEISGPIIPDLLGIRVTGRTYAKDGSYQNTGEPGQTLGNQETKTGTIALVFKPSSNFTARAYGMLTTDNDGPSAQGVISAYTVKAGNGSTLLNSQSNCVLNGNPFICGVTPGLAQGPSATVLNDSYTQNFLANPTGRLVDPTEGTHGYGLVSRYYHLHLGMDWSVTDKIRLSSLTAYNNEQYSEFSDLDNYYDISTPNNFYGTIPGARSFFTFPYLVEQKTRDWSQELRASYDSGPFKGTVGVSYLDARYQNGLGGGNGGLGTTTFSSVNGATRNKTTGAFFGLSYQLTDKLSLSADGRYQIDHIFAYAPPTGVTITNPTFAPVGYYPGNSVLAQKNYKNFLPRVIAQYSFTPNTMFYASYSQGVNPGTFNTQFQTLSALVQQTAAADGFKIVVNPEKLHNYEIGLKGRLMDNKVRYSFAAYRAIWIDQINTANIAVFDPTTDTTSTITASINAGRVRMTGLEGNVTTFLTPNLLVDLAGAITDSHIEELDAPTVTQLTGISDFSGKQDPFVSKYSGVVGVEYSHALSALEDAKAYIRTDFVYKSGVFSDAANIVRTPAYKNVNLRIGVTKGPANVELFVTNLFNDRAYNNASDSNILTPSFQYAGINSELIVGLRDLRTAGIRVHYAL